jgi:hypothetical protein
LAKQEGAAAQRTAHQEEMKARQAKADVEAKALQEQLKEDVKGHTEALLEGLEILLKKEDSLPTIVSCQSKRTEGRPRSNGGRY